MKALFAFDNDFENKPNTLHYMPDTLSNRDAMDAGFMRGSMVIDMSALQYNKLMRLIDSCALFDLKRVAANKVRIIEY